MTTLLVIGLYLAGVLSIGLLSHRLFRGTGEDYFVTSRCCGRGRRRPGIRRHGSQGDRRHRPLLGGHPAGRRGAGGGVLLRPPGIFQ